MRLRVFYGAFVGALLLAGCGSSQISVTNVAGDQSAKIESLLSLTAVVLSVIFVLVIGWLAKAVSSSTRQPPGLAANPRPAVNAESDRKLSRIVGVLVLLVVLIEVGFLIASEKNTETGRTFEGKSAMELQITGHRWWWEVRYPNSQASLIVTTANEVHVPVGQLIRLEGFSPDVIHSFWAPNIAGKRDLIPG